VTGREQGKEPELVVTQWPLASRSSRPCLTEETMKLGLVFKQFERRA
jgi:hypothetical protein